MPKTANSYRLATKKTTITSKEVRHEKAKMGCGGALLVGCMLNGIEHDAILHGGGKCTVVPNSSTLCRRKSPVDEDSRQRLLLQYGHGTNTVLMSCPEIAR
jgi:hypothetical protein